MSAYPPQQGGVPPYAPPPYQPQGPMYDPMQVAAPTYATFWLRFAAVFIDGLIVGIPLNVIYVVLGLFGSIASTLISVVAYLLYEGLLLFYRNGQTVGKQVVKIR